MPRNNIKSIEKKHCIGCMACVAQCPIKCIELPDYFSGDGFYPHIDENQCIHCGKCVDACPASKSTVSSVAQFQRRMAIAYTANDSDRVKSSSGGVFPAVAKFFLKNGFVVYGATINNEGHVFHVGIDNENELPKIVGTKYIQSNISSCFSMITKDFENGKKVLFAGTPCQVAAIKKYLGLKYEDAFLNEHIYFIDVICHGVGEPWIWECFLNEAKKKGDVSNINFRDKENGWKDSAFSYCIDGEKKLYPGNSSSFMKAYSENLCIRESCFDCQYKGIERGSDLTLGDAWGYSPERQTDAFSGMSFIVIQSARMASIIDSMAQSGSLIANYDFDSQSIIRTNSCILSSTKKNGRKNEFEKKIKNGVSFGIAVKKVCHVPLYKRAINSIKFRMKIEGKK